MLLPCRSIERRLGGIPGLVRAHASRVKGASAMKQTMQPALCVAGVAEFDYASLPTSVAKFLKGQATRIRQYAGKSIIQIGKDLAAAKHYLSHGQFVRWAEKEVGIPARTAQGYMRAAQWAAGKSATVAHLPPSLLYVLSASSTPEELVEDILRKAEVGEEIVLSSVRASLKAWRDAKRRERVNGHMPDHSAAHDVNQTGTTMNGEAPLMEVVDILVRTLSKSDFVRIREIMTSTEVLQQSNLAQSIKIAFSAVPDWNMQGNGVRKVGVADLEHRPS